MDRRLILAVAGSGKSSYMIERLNLQQRFLVVTYTENNVAHLKNKIIRKFGYEPQNITLLSYFQFLIRVCYRPFLKDSWSATGVFWKMPDSNTLRLKRDNPLFYMTRGGCLYHNRLAKLCQVRCLNSIRERIERFYDCFMFDEVQDLGGHDFNLIAAILPLNIDVFFVGDFFQHTFDTSKDGNVNISLYKDINRYIKTWEKTKLLVDTTTLNMSYRCSPTVCDFVTNELGIPMKSHRCEQVEIKLVDNETEAIELYNDKTIVKLFFSESRKYNCYAFNWGASKGLDDFCDICIVLNDTTLKAYNAGKLKELKAETLNKFYVACTRAKGNIYFISNKFISKYKRKSNC